MRHIYRTRGGQAFGRHELSQWLGSPRGRRLIALETRELGRILPDLFGRTILQIGSWGQGGELIASSEMLQRAVLGNVADFGAQSLSLPEELPVQAKCVDVAVLPHTLEFSPSPHEVLREADRVLTDRGRLLILGFNRWSFWGIRQRLGLRYRAFPPGARLHSPRRVCEWLELLGYEITLVRRYGVGFPWVEPCTMGESFGLRDLLSPAMEAYLITARKRVIPLNLMRNSRRAQVRQMIGGVVSLPSARTPAE